MAPGLIWILLGLVALGAELALPGVYLLWVGLAAIGTGLVLLVAAPGLPIAVAIFLALLAAGILASLRFRSRTPLGRRANAPEAGLAGREAEVLSAEGGRLRVRLGDSDWSARVPRGVEPPALGSRVKVEAVDGTVLIVRPAG